MIVNSRPSFIEVNLDHLVHNLHQVQQQASSSQVMAVVKANAYGHGLIPVSKKLEAAGVHQIGVAFLEEGIALRQAGIQCPILVFGGLSEQQIPSFLEHDLALTLSSTMKLEQVEAVAKHLKQTAKVHLKIDTGMERIGVHSYSCATFIEQCVQSKHLQIEGVYSHLACSETPENPTTLLQIERFEEACSHFERLSSPMPTRHLANSGGILYYPQTHYDLVRPGILLYGVYPDAQSPKTLEVQPVLSLKSQVVYFKVVLPEHPVSYGGTWQSDQMTRVVTLPIGYGDGFRRALSNKGDVLIHGKRYPIIGNVCMDQFMVNLNWDSAHNGDEVVLIGKSGHEEITAEDMAQWCNTIAYEILTGFNDRIPRVYLES